MTYHCEICGDVHRGSQLEHDLYATCYRNEITKLRADLAAAHTHYDTDYTAERRAYAEMVTRVIEATGVEVPVGGITAPEAVAKLRADLAASARRYEQVIAQLNDVATRLVEVGHDYTQASHCDACERCRAMRVKWDAATPGRLRADLAAAVAAAAEREGELHRALVTLAQDGEISVSRAAELAGMMLEEFRAFAGEVEHG